MIKSWIIPQWLWVSSSSSPLPPCIPFCQDCLLFCKLHQLCYIQNHKFLTSSSLLSSTFPRISPVHFTNTSKPFSTFKHSLPKRTHLFSSPSQKLWNLHIEDPRLFSSCCSLSFTRLSLLNCVHWFPPSLQCSNLWSTLRSWCGHILYIYFV